MNVENIKLYFYQLNWLIVVFTLLIFLLLIKLGVWQINRASEKELRLTRIAQLTTQAPMNIAEVLDLSLSFKNINDLPVTVSGLFNNEKIFLLDNQVSDGRLGYRVLQVLEGQSKAQYFAVLVNLGWVQGSIDRSQLPIVATVTAEQTFEARTRLVEKGIVLLAQDYSEVEWPFRVQHIDLKEFSTVLGVTLLPFVLHVDEAEAVGFKKKWQPIVMPPEKHRAYAFQWFSLAVAWLILMVSASIWFGNNSQQRRD